jgi:hypothetical protein
MEAAVELRVSIYIHCLAGILAMLAACTDASTYLSGRPSKSLRSKLPKNAEKKVTTVRQGEIATVNYACWLCCCTPGYRSVLQWGQQQQRELQQQRHGQQLQQQHSRES